MSSSKILKFFRIPTDAHSPSFSPLPSPGYHISGKEVEVHDSGSPHHQLCRHHDLQLIQSHVAPSHGPPARVLSPLIFPAKSLLLPKPCGKRCNPKPYGPDCCPSLRVPTPQKLRGPPHYFEAAWSLLYFRAAWSLLLLQSRMVSPLYFRAAWSLLLWLPGLGLNPSAQLPLQPISDSSHNQLHLPVFLYSSSFTRLP